MKEQNQQRDQGPDGGANVYLGLLLSVMILGVLIAILKFVGVV